MATETTVPIDVLTDVVRERARAEAREVALMLEFRDAEMERIALVESPMKRLAERGSLALAIGEAMGFSEGQVVHRLSFADTVRDHSPTTWNAFTEGRIDLARVREIGHPISQLKRAESVHRLDARVVEHAETHTVAELRAWLKRFVRRVEADLATERAEDERAKRHVSVQHGDDSMGYLGAYLASHELAAIADRIRKEARRPVEPGDDRTVAQREADLVVAWLLSTGSRSEGEAAEGVIDANIGVTIDADVLAGANPGFAESTDGTWGVPAAWIAAVIASGSTFWHRIVVDPVSDDVLAHEYVGRFPTTGRAERGRCLGEAQQRRSRWSGEGRAAHPIENPGPKGPPAVRISDRCVEDTTATKATGSCTGPPDPKPPDDGLGGVTVPPCPSSWRTSGSPCAISRQRSPSSPTSA